MKYVAIWFLALAVVAGVGAVVAAVVWLFWRVYSDPSMTWVLGIAGTAVIIATIAACLEYLQDRNPKEPTL
jgi:hypothetical protein